MSAESRHHAAGNIRRRAIDNKWPHVMLFPEGTTTNGQAIISFKTGAFSPGLPVQPMIVRYPHKHVNPCWADQGGPLVVLFHLMTQFVNYMEVRRVFLLLSFFIPENHSKLSGEAYSAFEKDLKGFSRSHSILHCIDTFLIEVFESKCNPENQNSVRQFFCFGQLLGFGCGRPARSNSSSSS